MITADGVVVRLGNRTVLDRVDVAVRTGHVVGVIGPNGSGKSTLLRALLGVVPLAAGRITVDGDDLTRLRRREIARRISFVGQHVGDGGSLRVREEVALGGLARRGTRAVGPRGDAAARTALETIGLADLAETPVSALSGGERQRVAIARALLHGADHALLDEPMNHLDVRHRLELAARLRQVAPTVLVVLHDLDLAARTCDHLVLLDRGRVIASGTPAEVLRPVHLDPVYGVRSRTADIDGIRHLHFDLAPSRPEGSSR